MCGVIKKGSHCDGAYTKVHLINSIYTQLKREVTIIPKCDQLLHTTLYTYKKEVIAMSPSGVYMWCDQMHTVKEGGSDSDAMLISMQSMQTIKCALHTKQRERSQ